ncbi:hypothetical protein BHE74_00008788 [Ensete ventricosum]|nr:hypothetical protein BHE74_00008788 [Ensete ventricosum]
MTWSCPRVQGRPPRSGRGSEPGRRRSGFGCASQGVLARTVRLETISLRGSHGVLHEGPVRVGAPDVAPPTIKSDVCCGVALSEVVRCCVTQKVGGDHLITAAKVRANLLKNMGLWTSLLFIYLILICFVDDVLSGLTSSFMRSEWPSTDIPLDSEAFVVPGGYNTPQQVRRLCFREALRYRVSNINYNITSGSRRPVPDKSAPVYITVGDGGNQEGLAVRSEKNGKQYEEEKTEKAPEFPKSNQLHCQIRRPLQRAVMICFAAGHIALEAHESFAVYISQ